MRKSSVLMIFAILFLVALLFSHWYEARQRSAEIRGLQLEQHEIDRLNESLDGKADDCVVRREWYGFSCTEIKTGKKFKVIL